MTLHKHTILISKMGDSMDVDGGTMEVDMADETENLRDEHPSTFVPARRLSMSHEEQHHRRASIKAILADDRITPVERRRSIQYLMDGRRSSIGTASVASSAGSIGGEENPYGYGDSDPYGYGDDAGPTPRNHDTQYGDDTGMSFDPQGEVCVPISNEATKRAEQNRPHCGHYERKCTLIAPCCGAAFGCRICHDDSPILPPLLIQRQAMRRQYHRSSSMPMNPSMIQGQTPEDTHHVIDRFKVKEIICRECYTKQSADA